MSNAWNIRVRELINQRTEIQEAELGQAFRHVRLAVPKLTVGRRDTPGVFLQWSPESVRPSPPLGSLFWDFVSLADASDETIIAFAEHFGPLRWPEPVPVERIQADSAIPTREEDEEWDWFEPGTEPVRVWKMYARGLSALYDLIDPALAGQAPSSQIMTWSLAPAAIPYWMADPDSTTPALEEGWLVAFVTSQILAGDDFQQAMAWSDRLMVAALAAAGVDPAYPPRATSKLVYTLPASLVTPKDGQDRGLWQVKGMLPILITSLAFAVRTQERPRCTRCGRPAKVITRGPRAGRAWYGEHAVCRALARAETMAQAEERRADQQRQAKRKPTGEASPRQSDEQER